MARQTEIHLSCDLCRNERSAAVETVRVGMNGHDWEFDLCRHHLIELVSVFTPSAHEDAL